MSEEERLAFIKEKIVPIFDGMNAGYIYRLWYWES